MFYVICGIPGSGKSTLARSIAEQYGAALYEFDSLPGAFSPSSCEAVRAQMWADIAADLRLGKTVVCDDLHTLRKWRTGLLQATDGLPVKRVLVVMDTQLDECLRRNANRQRRLPDFVIQRIAESYEHPVLDEGWDKIIYKQSLTLN